MYIIYGIYIYILQYSKFAKPLNRVLFKAESSEKPRGYKHQSSSQSSVPRVQTSPAARKPRNPTNQRPRLLEPPKCSYSYKQKLQKHCDKPIYETSDTIHSKKIHPKTIDNHSKELKN